MSNRIRQGILGYSAQGRPIQILHLTPGHVPVLLLAGVHGDEIEGIRLLQRWVSQQFPDLSPDLAWDPAPFQSLDLWAIPCVNPDGVALQHRCNGRGVDLNRNLPSRDWIPTVLNPRYPPGPEAGSELETQLLVHLIEVLQPKAIVSLHSAFTDRCININGSDHNGSLHRAKAIAEAMSAHSGYPITTDIGYPTPGSLGTWAGHERGIPTLTLEVPKGQDPEQVWAEHGQALGAGIQFIGLWS